MGGLLVDVVLCIQNGMLRLQTYFVRYKKYGRPRWRAQMLTSSHPGTRFCSSWGWCSVEPCHLSVLHWVHTLLIFTRSWISVSLFSDRELFGTNLVIVIVGNIESVFASLPGQSSMLLSHWWSPYSYKLLQGMKLVCPQQNVQ
jgi:hypothetical protein